MVVDSLADVLVRIKNGWGRKLPAVKAPSVKFTNACLEILSKVKCVGNITKNEKDLKVELLYDADGNPPFEDLKRISKCSLRKYSDVDELRNLYKRYPHYLYVVSTNKGVMTAKDAVKQNIGGELLFQVC